MKHLKENRQALSILLTKIIAKHYKINFAKGKKFNEVFYVYNNDVTINKRNSEKKAIEVYKYYSTCEVTKLDLKNAYLMMFIKKYIFQDLKLTQQTILTLLDKEFIKRLTKDARKQRELNFLSYDHDQWLEHLFNV